MTRAPRDIRRREIGGPDPLDRRLEVQAPSPLRWLVPLLRTRSALGMAPSLTPAIIFLPLGVLLGPQALGLLSPGVLDHLDLAVTIALAVLGVFVGVALGREIPAAWRLFLAASLESAVTIAAVAVASAYFILRTGLPIEASLVGFVLALGLCASASSATSADPDAEPAAGVATRVADLDDVLPIALTMVVFALQPALADRTIWVPVLAPILAGLAVGGIGWLIFDRAESRAERSVFVLGALALAGGAAVSLHVSPLAVGLVAGLVWTLAPGGADRVVQGDLNRVQHPLVVLLLVTAGARWEPSLVALWLLAPFVLFRLAGKVVGAWISSRVVDVRAGDFAAYLMSPGVLAVALALNFRLVLPPVAGEVLLSVTAVGTAAFELFALAVVPPWRRERAA